MTKAVGVASTHHVLDPWGSWIVDKNSLSAHDVVQVPVLWQGSRQRKPQLSRLRPGKAIPVATCKCRLACRVSEPWRRWTGWIVEMTAMDGAWRQRPECHDAEFALASKSHFHGQPCANIILTWWIQRCRCRCASGRHIVHMWIRAMPETERERLGADLFDLILAIHDVKHGSGGVRACIMH